MTSPGQQHHHGIKKHVVEGIGGVVIGAAAVLLLASLFKGKKPVAEPVAEKPAETPPAPRARRGTRRKKTADTAEPAAT